jgi:pilus assembly protein CpaC
MKPLLRAAAALALGVCVLAPRSAGAEPPRVPGPSAETSEDLSLAVGETLTYSARTVRNYSVAATGIIEVKLTSDARQFVFVGRTPGTTTVLLINEDGSQKTLNVTVFPRPPQLVEKELADLLDGLSVQTRRVGPQIVLDGLVPSEADLRRVQQIAALFPEQVTSLVQVSEPGALSGAAKARSLIRIDFYFVQYDKNSGYGVGIGWPDSIGGSASFSYDFLAGAAQAATANVIGQPLPRLDIAARRGWAKLLKQATVITNNDAEASFSNGGEQNVPISTGFTAGIERIQFGTEVTVLPHFDSQKGELSLRVAADVSDLSAGLSGSSLPGRLTSKLTTHVSLKLGQSLVLSGIRSQSEIHSRSGLPGLSEIPVLGLLFASHSQSSIETEGAIFVVPSVVHAVPNEAAELVNMALSKFEEYDGDLDEVKAYDARPGGSVNTLPPSE